MGPGLGGTFGRRRLEGADAQWPRILPDSLRRDPVAGALRPGLCSGLRVLQKTDEAGRYLLKSSESVTDWVYWEGLGDSGGEGITRLEIERLAAILGNPSFVNHVGGCAWGRTHFQF